jgi:4-hydroxy-2-oxoheptanedioate aldolase
MLNSNNLKKKLLSGSPVLGTWNTLASPLVTEVLALSGLDFQIIDLEHGPFTLDKIHLHVSACEISSNCSPLVRIPSNLDWMALQALDQGAHGLVVPHIENKRDSKKLIQSIKYYPSGNRGFSPFSKAGGFSNKNISDYVNYANESLLSVVIVESKEGLERLDEIAEIDGIDVVYFGAYDISQALGYPGEAKHPEVVRSIQKGVELVSRKGKFSGGFVPQSKDDIKWLLDIGMRFITYEVDSSMIQTHVGGITDWFHEETNK